MPFFFPSVSSPVDLDFTSRDRLCIITAHHLSHIRIENQNAQKTTNETGAGGGAAAGNNTDGMGDDDG